LPSGYKEAGGEYIGGGARSSGTRTPTNPIWTKASRFSTSRGTLNGLFAAQEPREKRRLLNFLLSNCTWEDGEVVATFREPFDMLAETAANSNRLESGVTFEAAKTEIWLGN